MNTCIANRYQLEDLKLSRIGRGGMGDVYRALDLQTNQIVAIKHLKTGLTTVNTHSVERFEREAEALRLLNHPNIVKILNTIQEQDEHYIVMEYVSGGSLQELIRLGDSIPIHRVMRIALELADALTRAHHLNIIHRDIKPANVLLAEDGTPRLTDFGVAHMEGRARITQTGALTGTYAYISPEACEGKPLDIRTDIWSFGVLLYELLTGRRPFEHEQLAATITAILTKPVPDITQFRPGIPEALTHLVYKMLKKDRNERINSVRLVGAQLEAIMSGSSLLTTRNKRFDTTTSAGNRIAPALGPRHNLPAQPTRFVGRNLDVEEVIDTLLDPDCRLLTLLGPGGMGKTRLAVESAHQLVEHFQHGVRFVPLAAITSADYIPTALAESLSITFSAEGEPMVQINNYLHEKEMLLVLDNLEHLLADNGGELDPAQIVADMLAHAPHLKIIATSRENLNLWEEWTRPVRGMTYPETIDTPKAEEYSAVRLFASRAKRVRRGFNLDEALPQVIEICQMVEGMPLAIELAASWLKMLTPEQIVTEVRKGFDFLSTSMRNITSRHRSVRAVFDYSWQLLDEQEKNTFAKLSVFQGGFERSAAEKVAQASLLTLTNLVNKSLLYEENKLNKESTNFTGSYRYNMHELLKQYATDKQKTLSHDEQVSTSRAHAFYYLSWVAQLESTLKGANQQEALHMLRAEIENIRAAWQWSLENIADADVQKHIYDAIMALVLLHEYSSWLREGRELFTTLVEKLEAVKETAVSFQHLLACALLHRGIFRYRVRSWGMEKGSIRQPVERLRALLADEATPAEMRHKIRHDLTFGLVYLSVEQLIGDIQNPSFYQAAREESIVLAQASEDEWLLVRALNTQAIYAFDNLQKQQKLYRDCLTIAREVGDTMMVSRLLHNIAMTTPDQQEAQDLLFESLYLTNQETSVLDQGLFYSTLGQVVYKLGEYERSRDYLLLAAQHHKDKGLRFFLATDNMYLGNLAWAMKDLEQAEKHFLRSLDILQNLGNILQTASGMRTLGHFYGRTGQLGKGKQQFKVAKALLNDVTDSKKRAELCDRLGHFAVSLGLYDVAKRYFQKASEHFATLEDTRGVAWAAFNEGVIAYELGDFETAVTHLQNALTLHQQVNTAPISIAQIYHALAEVFIAQGNYKQAEIELKYIAELPHHEFTAVIKLIAIVDWAHLLIKHQEKGIALQYLMVAMQNSRYQPFSVPHRTMHKAHRLRDDLSAYLPADVVAEAEEWASAHHYQHVIEALLNRTSITL